jgi:hypothetical protein
MGRKGRCASALSNLLRRSTALATRWGGRRRYGPCDELPRPLSGGCREKTLNNHINVDALIQKGACRESRALSMDSFENTIALKNNSSNGGAYEITMETRIASPYLNALLTVTRNSPFREKCYPALPINLVCTCSLHSSKPRRLHALRGAFLSRCLLRDRFKNHASALSCFGR